MMTVWGVLSESVEGSGFPMIRLAPIVRKKLGAAVRKTARGRSSPPDRARPSTCIGFRMGFLLTISQCRNLCPGPFQRGIRREAREDAEVLRTSV